MTYLHVRMHSNAHGKQAKPASEKPSKPGWFATFTILDASGAISSSQLQNLIAPMKKLYQKTFGRK